MRHDQGSTIMHFRAPIELKEAFEAAAKANDRTGSQLFRDFMRLYVKQNAQGDLLRGK